MNDEIDIHEPEHDHLLDHEFDEDFDAVEAEANPLFDHADDDESEDDDAEWDEFDREDQESWERNLD